MDPFTKFESRFKGNLNSVTDPFAKFESQFNINRNASNQKIVGGLENLNQNQLSSLGITSPQSKPQPQGNWKLNTLGSVLNTLFNPVKGAELGAGLAKQTWHSAQDILGGAASDYLTGRTNKILPGIASLLSDVHSGKIKNPSDFLNKVNQTEFAQNSALMHAVNLPASTSSLATLISNPTFNNTKQWLGNVAQGANRVSDLMVAGGLGKTGIKAGIQIGKEIIPSLAENAAQQGLRKTLYQTGTERGFTPLGQVLSGNQSAVGKTGEVLKRGLDVGALGSITKAPLGQAITTGLATPIIKTGIVSGTYGLAQQGVGNLTGNEQIKQNANNIFNTNFDLPGKAWISGATSFFAPSGVASGMLKNIISESSLGKAAHPAFDALKKYTNPNIVANAARQTDYTAVENRLASNPTMSESYRNSQGQLDLVKATQDIAPTLTNAERTNAFNQINQTVASREGRLLTGPEQAKSWENYYKASQETSNIENKLKLQPGTLTAARNDTLTNDKAIAMANELNNFKGGTVPENIRQFLHMTPDTTMTKKELSRNIFDNKQVLSWIDRQTGQPIMAGLYGHETKQIAQRLKDYADTAARVVPLSKSMQARIESLGYQGVVRTPVISVGKENAVPLTTIPTKTIVKGGIQTQVPDIGAIIKSTGEPTFGGNVIANHLPKNTVSALISNMEGKVIPAKIQDKIAQATTEEIRGNRNIMGKAYDRLDKMVGLKPTPQKQLTKAFQDNLNITLEKAFPAGIITGKQTGETYKVTQEGIGNWLSSALKDLATEKNMTISTLNTRQLKTVFTKQDAKAISDAIIKALPSGKEGWKTMGAETITNTLRKTRIIGTNIRPFNDYFVALNEIKYSKNPLFMRLQYPLKRNLVMSSNGFNPFYQASTDTLTKVGKVMGLASPETIIDTLGRKGEYTKYAASIIEQTMQRGKYYGLDNNYKTIEELLTQPQDLVKAQDIVERILHYGSRTPLERTLNTVLFPFSFQKKIYTRIFGGLGQQSGLYPLLAIQGLNNLETYMNSPEYLKWKNENQGEAYLMEKLNPFHMVAYTNIPGQKEGLMQGFGLGQFGGQYIGGATAFGQGLNKAFLPQTNKKTGVVTPPPESAMNKTFALLAGMGSTAGFPGELALGYQKQQSSDLFKKNQDIIKQGDVFKSDTGNKLAYMQTVKLSGGSTYDKFFSENPTLDPTNARFVGFDKILNKTQFYADLNAGAAQAKSAGEKLAFMQNVALAGFDTYDKFFSQNQKLDPRNQQFQGFKKGSSKASSAKKRISARSKYALQNLKGKNKQAINKLGKKKLKTVGTGKKTNKLVEMLADQKIVVSPKLKKTTKYSLSKML